ncbi:phosphatidylinositol 4-phosphate 5-kinase-like protein 1 isoform X11 [Rhinolophus ferrumequinum]|uniref:phosphatidylinositol 4-phosphate 5-kinase-like protein 1 isoform X11 n=1 Tax=Rhinolophus ferrumequinum TaxID=59479 RepID=UPI00140F5D2A|nr:phosphatidylinositol 4-phosphate 5-kinase-like protein 1 isoform X11 [Rhinolophus ferrumequinum]
MAAPSPGPREVLAPSPEAGRRVATSSSSRGGLLWRLRDKQPRLGLFEIGPGHELHRLTCMMQAGLWAATQVSIDHPLLKYFIIMQSVFYPASRISERYDIKGCEVSRWVDPAPEGSPLILVLKDLNFQGKTIYLGLCKGYRARMSREPRTAGCCQKSPTPFTSWTDPNNATSWASWTLPLSTGSASGWSTCGRRCVTLAGPSPPSAQLATPVASTSGWRRTPSDQRRPASFPFGQWAHAESGFKPGRGRGSGSHCLLFLLLASRGQHSPANTRTTQPHLMVMLCRALCQGLPTLAHLMLKKCYYSLFTDHEMEAEGVKGLSKILQQ